MGPKNSYYTIFNTELSFIHYPLLFALIPAIITFVILFLLKKWNIVKWEYNRIILITGIIYLLSFVWFANWAWVVY